MISLSGRPAIAIFPEGTGINKLVEGAGFEPHLITGEKSSIPDSEEITDEAIAQIHRLRERGGLLWVHYYDPHTPNRVDPDFPWGDSDFDRYLSAVARWDRAVGRLLDAVPKDFSVVVAADHGEAFGEHGLSFHRTALYDEQLRVPLIISVPGMSAGVVKETVGLIDLYATLAELAGVPFSPESHSRSLVPALYGLALPPWSYRASTLLITCELGPAIRRQGVFFGPFKYIVSIGWNVVEVYDVSKDPGELYPNVLVNTEMTKRLRALY